MFRDPTRRAVAFAEPQQPKLTPQQQQKIEQAQSKLRDSPASCPAPERDGSEHSLRSRRQKFVDGVEEELFGHGGPIQSKMRSFITRSMRRRVAHAEFAAVSDPARFDSRTARRRGMERIYPRDWAHPRIRWSRWPKWHNLRDGMYTGSQRMWNRGGFGQSLWLIPGIYALDGDGRVAGGCPRMRRSRSSRHGELVYRCPERAERVQRGVLFSDWVKQPQLDADQPTKTVVLVSQSVPLDLISSCARRYSQEHGQESVQRTDGQAFSGAISGLKPRQS